MKAFISGYDGSYEAMEEHRESFAQDAIAEAKRILAETESGDNVSASIPWLWPGQKEILAEALENFLKD